MSSVSKNLKKVRLQRKLTQEDLANKLFVTRQTVSNWENGKSQPDIEMLINIAQSLDADITTLIYGLHEPAARKKEIKYLFLAVGLIFMIGISLYFLTSIAREMMLHDFNPNLMMLLHTIIQPIFWFLLSWTIMQGLGILGVLKPTKSKYNKFIHTATLIFILLYIIIMLPYFIESVKCMVLLYQYNQNPSLHPNGFSYIFKIPKILSSIELSIINVVYRQPVLFIIPSIFFWFSNPNKKGWMILTK